MSLRPAPEASSQSAPSASRRPDCGTGRRNGARSGAGGPSKTAEAGTGSAGGNEISPRNNLEDTEVAVKMPRLRIRLGKAGCNGRGAMRFHRVIILFETVSCLKPVARRGGFGNRGPPRGVMRSDAMNCGPPRVCLGSRRRGEKQKRTRFRLLPITRLSRPAFP